MDARSVRTALGTLQNNPDDSEAWQELRDALSEGGGDLDQASALALLEAARNRHASRGEAEAVVRIYDLCAAQCHGTALEVSFLQNRATVLLTELFAGLPAIATLARAASLPQAEAGLEAELSALQERAAAWKDQAASYHAEAESAPDDLYRSAMMMRAAEAEICFAEEPRVPAIVENLEMALRLDPSNLPASRLLEVIYRRADDTAGLVRVLERTADRAPSQEARVAAGIRLGRYLVHAMRDEERAAASFDRVLESDPENTDAMSFVTEYYSRTENWDALVRAYERPLKSGDDDEARLGDMLQVGMLHWKKRGVLADAEPWFERIRKLQPAHEGVLSFYREYKGALHDDVGLARVLDEAKRALDEASPERASIEAELSTHASSQADLQRQIEQQKSLLRNNPDDAAARERLKTLYKQTQGHNALVELLRQQLERTPEEEYETRLAIMREIAGVYREYIKSETALVGVLNQIVQLDGKLDAEDVGEVRELVSLFDKLGRPRDLLASQKLLAEIVPDVEEKKALYRQVGRRWLDQFSNVQHAMEAFAALYELDPTDEEAIERLDDLYRKRRAWKELFALYETQLSAKTGAARIPLLREMAQLAAEHLSRVDDALGYYREILDLDPSRLEVLDRYEKHAERSKSWALLADALERRIAAGGTVESQLPILQKLGTVYSDHLDRQGEAVRTWRRVVELQPGNARAMRVLRDSYLKAGDYDALEAIYVAQNDQEGLAEVLSTAADRAREAEAKLDLSYRAARVYEEGLRQSARAIRSYERILSVDPDDVRAIDRLLPLYENDEKWARVPPLLEVKYRLSTEEDERVTLLSQLFTVASSHLFDRRAAIGYARRAFELAPRDARCLEMFDSASRAGGGWEDMMQALEQRLLAVGGPLTAGSVPPPAPTPEPEVTLPAAETGTSKRKRGGRRRGKGKAAEETTTPPPAVEASSPVSIPPQELSEEERGERRAVGLRLARVLGEELGRVDEAVQRLKALAGEFEDDGEILDLLEAMLRRQASKSDLRWLYHHREKRAKDAADKAVALLEWAQFEEREAGKPDSALELYRRVLSTGPGSVQALDAVVRLATELGQPGVAIDALEKHRELAEGRERADKEVELGGLYLAAERWRDALDAILRALEAGSEPGLVIPILQRLADVPDLRAEATRILSEQYEAGGDARKESEALRSLIAETSSADKKVELLERLAGVYEQKLAEPGSALGVVLDAIRIRPGAQELWDRAHELAGASGRPVELADAYKEILSHDLEADVLLPLAARAGELHETILGDAAGAVPYYEKILAIRPDDEEAFTRLREILTGAERWQELEQLYDREIARLEDPGRQLEMLAEVALLAEDIMGDPARAATYHERILKLEPSYGVSLESLDRIHSRLGQKAQLLDVLDRRAELTSGTELSSLLLRVGQIALEEHQPERSMKAIERVLEDESGSYEARDVAERLLQIGSVRVRASRCLEVVYEAQDEIRDLVRVLGVRVEALRPGPDETFSKRELGERESERRDLLRRIATLKDDRLHDDEGSFEVFAELVPLDPDDLDLRERLIDSGRRLGRGVEVIGVLLAAEKNAAADSIKAEILSQAASVQQDTGDSSGAEATWTRVMSLSASEPEAALQAARHLEAVLVRGARHPEVVANLQAQIGLETDFERKAELLARVAQLSIEVLGDPKQAISAWETRLTDSPDDAEALQNLTELYERTQRYQDLGRVLVTRRDAAVTSEERLRIVRHLADVEERHLGDISRAIESYQVLLDEGGADPASYKALVRLFQKEERYDDLADVLTRQADVVEERAEELEALALLGKVKSDHLGDAMGAIEAYRRALGLDERHEPSLEALALLLEHEDPSVRLDAAGILEPIYAAARNHEGLIRVLTTQAEASEDFGFVAACFERCAEIHEDLLKDPARALEAVDRGLVAAAKVGEVDKWLARLERLASASGARQKQVEVLTHVVSDMYDSGEQLAVQKRIAELQQNELGDTDAAIAAYGRALELQSEDKESLLALEKLHLGRAEYAQLLDVLERRAELAESDSERKALLYRRAEILAQRMGEADRAIETYESILDMSFEAPALEAVEALYTASERYDDLVSLTQRRIESADRGAPDLRVKLAGILWEKQHDIERALDELEQTLTQESQHAGAVRYLESRLSGELEPSQRARVAALLEPVYMLKADYTSVLKALELRVLGAEDPGERRELLTRIAKIHEEQREDYAAALEVTAQLLSADPADLDAAEEMERLAKVAGAPLRLAELFEAPVLAPGAEGEEVARLARRAGEIFAAQGQDARALVLLRRALEAEPEDVRLFELVDRLLSRSGTPTERVELHRAALDHRFDAEEQVALLHVIAQLSKDALQDPAAAIEAHQRVLSIDDRNVVSQDELTVLYASAGRYDDLAELYLGRAEPLAPAEGARYRLALAALYVNQLGQPESALDQLEEIVRELPAHEDAIGRIEALRNRDDLRPRVVEILRPIYEADGDWRKLIRLNEDRFRLAEDVHEKLAILRETAELWELRGEDAERALRVFAEGLRLVPDDDACRSDVERLVLVTARWQELAELYAAILRDNPDLLARPEILRRLAEILDERMDDARGALRSVTELVDLDSTDEWALAAMKRLSTLLGDWPALERCLKIESEGSLAESEQISVLLELGELRLLTLGDEPGAVSAYEQALEIDDHNAAVLDRLIAIHEGRAEAGRLVDLYLLRVDTADADDDLRHRLQRRAAHLLETKLGEPERAIEALGQALIAQPGDAETIAELNRLYRAQKMWSELLDNLRLEAGTAETVEKRLSVRHEIARILAAELESYDESLEAYGVVLDERPDDEVALDAVFAVAKREEHLRPRAADLLVPALRQTGLKARLAEALELRHSTEQDPLARVETLRAIAHIKEADLGDLKGALASLLRAIADGPEARDLYDELERLAEATGMWAKLADGIAERAAEAYDSELAAELWVRVARVRETHLKQVPKAIEAYQKATEAVGDRLDLLDALDRLYTVEDDTAAVVELLERRMALADTDEAQAKILTRQGQLLLEKQKDPVEALRTLRSALERDVQNEEAAELMARLLSNKAQFEEAFDVLDDVYRRRASGSQLSALHQMRVDAATSPSERLEMRRSLAEVLEHDCQDPLAAQRVLEAALADDLTDVGIQDDVERLANTSGAWQEAASALLDATAAAKSAPKDVRLESASRAAMWFRDRADDRAGAERALNLALTIEPKDEGSLEQLDALLAVPGREADLLGVVQKRVELTMAEGDRLELLWRAEALATAVSQTEVKERILRAILTIEAEDVKALERLTEIRRTARDFQETYDLLLTRTKLEHDADRLRALRVDAANIAQAELGQLEQATAILEEIFEESPRDQAARDALAAAYGTGKRYADLDQLLRRLIDSADVPSEGMDLSIRLARVRLEHFSDVDGAVALLEGVLAAEPGHAEAGSDLANIYESAGRSRDLADLLERQVAVLRAAGAADASLSTQKRLAKLCEAPLGDLSRAAAAWSVVRQFEDTEEVLSALLRLHTALGEKAAAAEVLEALASRAAGAEAIERLVALAHLYTEIGDQDAIVRSLDRARDVDPESPELRTRLRAEYERAGAWRSVAEMVLADAEAAGEKKTKVDLYREAASIHLQKLQDPSGGADILQKAVDLSPEDRGLLLDLCDAVSLAGRGAEAVQVLEKIVESYGGKRSKELGEIHRRLANAYLAMGQREQALGELDKAFRIEPGNIHVLRQLGDVAMESGDMTKAQQMFRALLLQRLDGQSPISKAQVFCRLGQIHQALGEGPKAKQMFERAVQADPQLEEAKRGLSAVS